MKRILRSKQLFEIEPICLLVILLQALRVAIRPILRVAKVEAGGPVIGKSLQTYQERLSRKLPLYLPVIRQLHEICMARLS